MTTKMTKVEMFKQILSHLTDPAEQDFIAHEVALLEGKAERAKNSTHKPTKTQAENEKLKDEILAFMKSEQGAVTIADVRKQFDISSQKATPLMKALVDEGTVVKTVEKKVAHFSLA